MNITECPWELDNLGCRVAEISLTQDDEIDHNVLTSIENQNDYVVIKVESGKQNINIVLAQYGYVLAETQLTLQKNRLDWQKSTDDQTQILLRQMRVERIVTQEDFDELMDLISENMFSTDRIYLDPKFGPSYSVRRYKNWIKTEWGKGSLLYKHYFRDAYVGFSLSKLCGDSLSCLLAGCFEKYQKTGIGFWIPMIPLLYSDINYKNYSTHISTNNYPVWQMYNRHQYQVTKFEYVFVKHLYHNNNLFGHFYFHHIGYAVRDIEKTAAAYKDLGYSHTPIVYDEIQNVYICFVKKSGMPSIELIAPHDDKSPVVKILNNNGVTPYHCCYEVGNLESAIKELKKLRFMPISNPAEACAMDGQRIIFMYKDSFGLIELTGK